MEFPNKVLNTEVIHKGIVIGNLDDIAKFSNETFELISKGKTGKIYKQIAQAGNLQKKMPVHFANYKRKCRRISGKLSLKLRNKFPMKSLIKFQ